MAVLVGVAGLIGCSPSSNESSVKAEPRYSALEAAAKIKEKLADREYQGSSRKDSCLPVLPDYRWSTWLPGEKAHDLTFRDRERGRTVHIKYFESSDTMLLNTITSTNDDEGWKEAVRACV